MQWRRWCWRRRLAVSQLHIHLIPRVENIIVVKAVDHHQVVQINVVISSDGPKGLPLLHNVNDGTIFTWLRQFNRGNDQWRGRVIYRVPVRKWLAVRRLAHNQDIHIHLFPGIGGKAGARFHVAS